MSRRRALGGARRAVVARHEVLAAVRQAKAFSRADACDLRICWDLDNTLVDSGSLVRRGTPLDEAIVEAYPVPNMVDFYRALRAYLPDARNFILSARGGSMRDPTFEWLALHGIPVPKSSVCLIPDAQAKPKVWRHLARGAALIIVDDLSFNHEQEVPRLYEALVAEARRIAVVYVGLKAIAEIAADPCLVAPTAASVASALPRKG